MANVTFVLRDVHAPNDTAIYGVLRFSNQSVKIRTGLSIAPKYWNPKKRRVNSKLSSIEVNEFNAQLDDFESKIKSEFYNFTNEHNREPGKKEIKKIIENKKFGNSRKSKVPKDLYGYWEYFLDNQRKVVNPKTGQYIKPTTLSGLKNTLGKVKDFEDSTNYKISFENIDLDFYYSFIDYLENIQLSVNTIGKHIKNLKTILNDATTNGINQNLKFKNRKFKVCKEETTEIYLNEIELQEIENLDLEDNLRLDKARDLLLILCYTGQRYQSLKDIVNVKNRDSGFIELKQEKSGKKVIIPILPPVEKIFNKYNDKLDVLSNVRLNKYIKEVCKLVSSLNKTIDYSITKGGMRIEVKKRKFELVCTHTGRRSFATNFYKRGDFPISQIMAITGHTSETTFFTYIRTTPNEHAKLFMDAFRRTQKLKVAN